MKQSNPNFTIVDSASLSENEKHLLAQAKDACSRAYAPYSRLSVGVAILLSDHTILTGSNMENASFPLCLCAERSALAVAHCIHPGEIIETMAVTAVFEGRSPEHALMPCGACRQVIAEYEQRQGRGIRIMVTSPGDQTYIFQDSNALLPHNFKGTFLKL